jgi:HAE1 family hydrophobic/amphiphilic exporter-1
MQGVDRMLYMNSVNDGTGVMKLRVTFEVGTNPNDDQLLSQMRYSLAESQLPQDVRNYGVSVKKSPSAPFAIFSVYSPRGTYDGAYLSNYA